MKSLSRNASSYLLLAALLLFGGASGYILGPAEEHHHQVLITLESSAPIETQLYYDTGRGFNEGESIKSIVYPSNVPVTLDFDIPGPKLSDLRFDPSRSHARIKIFEIMMQDNHETPFAIPLNSLTAAKDIKTLQYDGKVLIVETTEAARDPILLLGSIGQVPKTSNMKTILHIAAGVLITLAVAFFIFWVYRNSSDLKE